MATISQFLIDNTVQCWSCPVFDNLFRILSDAAAAVYDEFVFFCIVLFCVIFAFFVINAVWQNIKGGATDPWYQKSIKPVVINSLIALTFLGMGVSLPRFMTTITFEPIAEVSLVYTQGILNASDELIKQNVGIYEPEPMSEDGFFRPQLRDTIIKIMETVTIIFKNFMGLGIALMDNAFSWSAILGIGAVVSHIILFFIGLYLLYGFFKLFVRFCFYFADIIVAMMFFAFFFPLSLMLMAFKGAGSAPSWLGNLGKNIGIEQTKNLIAAIIGLSAAVITYMVIMVIIANFFASGNISAQQLMSAISEGTIYELDLEASDALETLSLGSCIILMYVLNYLYTQIPNVKKMILNAFNVSEKTDISESLANDATTLTKAAYNTVKSGVQKVVSGGETPTK